MASQSRERYLHEWQIGKGVRLGHLDGTENCWSQQSEQAIGGLLEAKSETRIKSRNTEKSEHCGRQEAFRTPGGVR